MALIAGSREQGAESSKNKDQCVFARKRSNRTRACLPAGRNLIGIKGLVLILSILATIPIFSSSAMAWGSITHSAICRDAGGGDDFAMGGIAPDMIALYAVTTGDASYDYAHNCYGNRREPVFGNILAGISTGDFASGWRAHQLADSVVHGENGYSTSKTLFMNLPGRYGTDINHGAVELVVDAIVLNEYYRGNVSLYMPEQSELIHSGAVTFYNRNIGGGHAIPRSSIIGCRLAQDLTFNWLNCVQTNVFLAQMLVDEPWFSELRKELSDYREPYSRSVALLNDTTACRTDKHGFLQALIDVLVFPRIAKAAETGAKSETGNSYYIFLNEVSKRAREIGGGKATEESTRLAIDEICGDRSIPAEQRAWAEALTEMTNGRNKNLAELEKGISGRLVQGRDGSNKGAASGRGVSLLPYLPCSVSMFLIAVIFVSLLRTRRR